MCQASAILAVIASLSAAAAAFVPPLRHLRHRCCGRGTSYSYRISISTTVFESTDGGGDWMQVEEESHDSFLATATSTLDLGTVPTATPSSSYVDTGSSSNINKLPLIDSLLDQAQQQLVRMKQEIGSRSTKRDTGASDANEDEAALLFDILAQAFQIDPTSSKVSGMFMEYLRWKVEVAEQKYNDWKKRREAVGSFSQYDNNGNNRPELSNNDDLHFNNSNKCVLDEDVVVVDDDDDDDDDDDVSTLPEKDMNDLFQDRIGLSSLYIDREQYDMAGKQLRLAIDEVTFWIKCSTLQQQGQTQEERDPTMPSPSSLRHGVNTEDISSSHFKHWEPQIDRARYLLYRTNAACCQWGTYFEDGDRLRQSLLLHYHNHARHEAFIHSNGTSTSSSSGSEPHLPIRLLVHPFDALKFPCISLELASTIAKSYAHRSLEAMGVSTDNLKANIEPRLPRTIVTIDRHESQHRREIQRRDTKIRVGYISPDFTSRHPLAFLMQNVFACHDKSQFIINIYSLSSPPPSSSEGQEVEAIRKSSDQFTYLAPSTMSPMEMYEQILRDEVDILVDLCGYAGTSFTSEIMASRCRLRQDEQQHFDREGLEQRRRFPVHVSYMGFPGSVGSSMLWDYSVFDKVVIPTEVEHDGGNFRRNYEEALVYMPHSYFVNSHKSAIGGKGDGIMLTSEVERRALRRKYGIPPSAFVYCCHSRPDKIDPTTFRSWMRALSRVWSIYQRAAAGEKNEDTATVATVHEDVDSTCYYGLRTRPVLWLLRSGDEMENNIRRLVREEFGQSLEEECLVFGDIAERREHLHRLGIADVFLDTPSYAAHTLGCDALYLGVPMVSLLRNDEGLYDADVEASWDLESDETYSTVDGIARRYLRSIATNKLASRVGASLLTAVGLDELIYQDMDQYENAMVRCALDQEWFDTVRKHLLSAKDSSPLFDTDRWTLNLEAAFASMVEPNLYATNLPDIVILDLCD